MNWLSVLAVRSFESRVVVQRHLAFCALACCSLACYSLAPVVYASDNASAVAGSTSRGSGLAQPIVVGSAAVEKLRAARPKDRDKSRARNRDRSKVPLLFGFAELRNPVALLVATKNRFWSAAQFRMTDSVGAFGATDLAPIDVTFGMVRPYRLSSPASSTMAQIASGVYSDLHTGLQFGSAPTLVRSSAAQLNLRVNDAVSLLWAVDRSDSVVDGSEVGMGMGFKVAF